MALKERGQWWTKLLSTAKMLGIMMPIISLALMVLAAAKAYSSTHQVTNGSFTNADLKTAFLPTPSTIFTEFERPEVVSLGLF